MKKKTIQSYEELIGSHYGHVTPQKIKDLFGADKVLKNYYGGPAVNTGAARSKKKQAPVLAKSFDNGEVLPQRLSKKKAGRYAWQSSITDLEFEEYVVENTIPETPAYVPAEKTDQVPSVQTSVMEEYQMDLMEPLADRPVHNPGARAQSFSAPPVQKQPVYHAPAQDTTVQHAAYEQLSDEEAKGGKSNEDDFIADMQSILTGQKVFDPVTKKTVDKDRTSQSQSSSGRHQSAGESGNEHAIFDRIAKSMEYANAYDLGTVELDKRFADFDNMADLKKRTPSPKKETTPAVATPASVPASVPASMPAADNTDFIQDLDAIIRQQSAETTTTAADAGTETAKVSADWPPRPITIRPYTSAERTALFGHFTYEPDPSTYNGDGIKVKDNWMADNIVPVSIPQLNGKKVGNQTITNGTIQFHQLGAEQLQKLWQAWEAAGLLDRIETFEGGYAARFIRHTQNRNPRPLSNHAWGTAFDINAPWNGFGQEPALLHQRGCVRELVAIANEHGFFWGGHFNGNKDGMHFELGKLLI